MYNQNQTFKMAAMTKCCNQCILSFQHATSKLKIKNGKLLTLLLCKHASCDNKNLYKIRRQSNFNSFNLKNYIINGRN